MSRIIKVSHDMFEGVDVKVRCKNLKVAPINSKPRSITKSLRGSLKTTTKQIEIIGSFKEQCEQIRDLNKTPVLSFVISLSQGDPIKSTIPPKEVWRPVTKRERNINRMADIKILRELWNAKRSK